jgi:hypothetical protein
MAVRLVQDHILSRLARSCLHLIVSPPFSNRRSYSSELHALLYSTFSALPPQNLPQGLGFLGENYNFRFYYILFLLVVVEELEIDIVWLRDFLLLLLLLFFFFFTFKFWWWNIGGNVGIWARASVVVAICVIWVLDSSVLCCVEADIAITYWVTPCLYHFLQNQVDPVRNLFMFFVYLFVNKFPIRFIFLYNLCCSLVHRPQQRV